ncbi:hypothetical protein BCR43DRAFT_186467 [Syncephalastrum racemosum]|uniref:F-box domain-containing protein n=1 Tax=Syncephalastrum racemosum TaxID=13706 RepID=A0A1X2HQH5_SYNRA|nr:hypothetical protein BCR43DRAFT_186467 [Syncephalastrum racemosum]
MSSLPVEIALIILKHLDRQTIYALLTVDRQWHAIAASIIYKEIHIRSMQECFHYRNLFVETRRQRQRQQTEVGFYSRQDYGKYVRVLDLSTQGQLVNDGLLLDFGRDCPSLERINLHNAYQLTSGAIQKLCAQCPWLRHLHIPFATMLRARFLLDPHVCLETLNIYGLQSFFNPLSPDERRSLRMPHLRTLKLGRLEKYDDLNHFFENVQSLWIQDASADQVHFILQQAVPNRLEAVELFKIKLTQDTLSYLPSAPTMLSLERCRYDHFCSSANDCDVSSCILQTVRDVRRLKKLSFRASHTFHLKASFIKPLLYTQLRTFVAPPNLVSDTFLSELTQQCPLISDLSITVGRQLSVDGLCETLYAYQSTLTSFVLAESVYDTQSYRNTRCYDRAFLQFHSDILQTLRLAHAGSELIRRLPILYPALCTLYIGHAEDMDPKEVDNHILPPALPNLKAFMLRERLAGVYPAREISMSHSGAFRPFQDRYEKLETHDAVW